MSSYNFSKNLHLTEPKTLPPQDETMNLKRIVLLFEDRIASLVTCRTIFRIPFENFIIKIFFNGKELFSVDQNSPQNETFSVKASKVTLTTVLNSPLFTKVVKI